jgi:hypothetical protein
LIPILTSFLCSHNQTIVTKSSELFSIIKEKILDELFEVNQEIIVSMGDDLNMILGMKNNVQNSFNQMKNKLEEELDKFKKNLVNIERECSLLSDKIGVTTGKSSTFFKRNTRKGSHPDFNQRDVNESLSNINEFEIKDVEIKPNKTNKISSRNSERDNSEIIINDNDNLKICNKTVSSNSIATINVNNNNKKFAIAEKNFFKDEKARSYNKTSFSPLDSNQIRFLFKGFIGEEDDNFNFEEKLSSGIYSMNFYKNIYTKYNGLTETLACKRKHVCIKLLQILKLFVRVFHKFYLLVARYRVRRIEKDNYFLRIQNKNEGPYLRKNL